MTPLDRALALAEREHVAVVVAEHLNLDVACGLDRLLDVEGPVAERGLRLARRARVRIVELIRAGNEPHALAAAAGARLQEDRVTDLFGRGPRLVQRRRPFRSRDERDPRIAQRSLRLRLVAHARHDLCVGADEHEVVLLARGHESRVLREEAPARMDGLAARRLRRRDHARDAQVALVRRRRPDADGSVGHAHVHRVLVDGRVHGDCLDPELVQRPDHADRDLAAVRDENPVKQEDGPGAARARTGAGRTRRAGRSGRGSSGRSPPSPP